MVSKCLLIFFLGCEVKNDCIEHNIDYHGADLKNGFILNLRNDACACQIACQKLSSCKFWTNSKFGCFLKYQKGYGGPSKRLPDINAISGPKFCIGINSS